VLDLIIKEKGDLNPLRVVRTAASARAESYSSLRGSICDRGEFRNSGSISGCWVGPFP
jgi:hypothetical protein